MNVRRVPSPPKIGTRRRDSRNRQIAVIAVGLSLLTVAALAACVVFLVL